MDIIEQTKAMLTGGNKWIIRHLPQHATTNQTPRDLITIAIRNAQFDVLSAGSKAQEIISQHESEVK